MEYFLTSTLMKMQSMPSLYLKDEWSVNIHAPSDGNLIDLTIRNKNNKDCGVRLQLSYYDIEMNLQCNPYWKFYPYHINENITGYYTTDVDNIPNLINEIEKELDYQVGI